GTWQFTAARLLERPINDEPLIHDRIDDIESFFHLTNWLALRYTPHSIDGSDLAESLRKNFEDSYVNSATGRTHISSHKRLNIVSGDLVHRPRFANKGVFRVLFRMQVILSKRYALAPPEDEDDDDPEQEEKIEQPRLKELGTPLDDPQWLPNLLTSLLDNPKIDWEFQSGFVNHRLIFPLKYTVAIKEKRKTDRTFNSEGSRKSLRLSQQSSPHGSRIELDESD
ncbi:hypothetical protein H0H93_012351, partial [Arthromyces matolae]